MVPARFAVAIHILLLAGGERPSEAATSVWLAARVHTNPVVVRRISGQLARAGLLRVRRGAGGAALARPAAAVTLEDVWQAVNADGARPLVALHLAGQPAGAVLAAAFATAEAAFHGALRGITLDQLAAQMAVAA